MQTNFMSGQEVTPPEGQSAVPTGQEPVEDTIQYPEGFDETLRGHESIKKFVNDKGEINHANVLKSYIHSQSLLGKDKMIMPNKDFTDENWNEFFDKAGRPSLEEYSIENNVPEGVEADEELFKNFKAKAHELGLLPRQAQGISDFYNSLISDMTKQQSEQSSSFIEEQKNILKKEWGMAFDKKITAAEAGLKQFASEEDIKVLKDLGIFDTAAGTKLFAKIGEGLAEDTFHEKAKGNFGMTPAEVKAKIETFYDPSHPYMNRMHPQNEYYCSEMVKLQEMLHGE